MSKKLYCWVRTLHYTGTLEDVTEAIARRNVKGEHRQNGSARGPGMVIVEQAMEAPREAPVVEVVTEAGMVLWAREHFSKVEHAELAWRIIEEFGGSEEPGNHG